MVLFGVYKISKKITMTTSKTVCTYSLKRATYNSYTHTHSVD